MQSGRDDDGGASGDARQAMPDARPWKSAVFLCLILALFGWQVLRWNVVVIGHRHAPSIVVGILALACVASICVLLMAFAARPAPRVVPTRRGLAIYRARWVSAAIWTVCISFAVVLPLAALLLVTGNLDFYTTDRGTRRMIGSLIGMAAVMPLLLIPPYLPAIWTWITGQRKPWHLNPLVLLSPNGVQIERVGLAYFVPWEDIADVRAEQGYKSRWQLAIYRKDLPPVVTEQILYLGGNWVVDIVRFYWHNPQERCRLTARSGSIG